MTMCRPLCVLMMVTLLFTLPLTGSAEPHVLYSPVKLTEDLDFIWNTLTQVHVDPFHSLPEDKYLELYKDLRSQLNLPMTRDEFFFLAAQLLVPLRDAHSNLFYNGAQRWLPVKFSWITEGLVVSAKSCGLSVGDKVTSIGGSRPDELLEKLRKVISAENEQWIRSLGEAYLPLEAFLKHFNLISDSGTVALEVVRPNGEKQAVELALTSEPVPVEERPWFGYEIDEEHSLGVFYLDICRVTEEYVSAVDEFFTKVHEAGIERVAIDVRRNTGGASRALDPLLKYLPKARVEVFDMQLRYSPEAKELRGYSRESGVDSFSFLEKLFGATSKKTERPRNQELIFDGDLYVLTSHKTFSSGNWIGVILKANGMATIVGEPTANAPTSFGDGLGFTLPNTRFSLQISHKKWIAPGKMFEGADCLEPDVIVRTTAASMAAGTDPQLDWLRRSSN